MLKFICYFSRAFPDTDLMLLFLPSSLPEIVISPSIESISYGVARELPGRNGSILCWSSSNLLCVGSLVCPVRPGPSQFTPPVPSFTLESALVWNL